MIGTIQRLLKEPLVHFLLASAGIYGLYASITGGLEGEDERTIVVSAAEVRALEARWAQLWQRPPTEEELAEAIRGSVRKEVLYREAVAMGLEKGDVVLERRLAQKLERLAQTLMVPEEPAEDELRAWFKENEEQFSQPDRFSLVQVYFDPDRRGAATLDDAKATLEKLQSLESIPADIANYGDRLMSRTYFENNTELELRKSFGSGFVEQVVTLEPGTWHGPALSGYGTHVVFLTEVNRAPAPEFSEFAEQVREGLTAEKVEQLKEQFVESLIARYEITIDGTDRPLTIQESNGSF